MGRLIYAMATSLDGYVSDAAGDFDWGVAEPEVHEAVNERMQGVGTHLLGRRMYEILRFWDTAHELPDAPPFLLEYARLWRDADKIVYSTTFTGPVGPRTRVEPTFDTAAVRRLKESSERDLAVSGPHLAAQAIRAGLVDEVEQFIGPAVAGGGTAFYPPGVHLDLDLLDERRFTRGVVHLRHSVRSLSIHEEICAIPGAAHRNLLA